MQLCARILPISAFRQRLREAYRTPYPAFSRRSRRDNAPDRCDEIARLVGSLRSTVSIIIQSNGRIRRAAQQMPIPASTHGRSAILPILTTLSHSNLLCCKRAVVITARSRPCPSFVHRRHWCRCRCFRPASTPICLLHCLRPSAWVPTLAAMNLIAS